MLRETEISLICETGHTYDISASGYCNLMRPGKLRNRRSGDDKAMISNRHEFLRSGLYAPIKDAVLNILNERAAGSVLLDAGCGEGYYTNAFAREHETIGIDASKYAVERAAKDAKALGISNKTSYITANLYELPIKSGSAAAVTSIFAPCSYSEFARVLKPGGHLIIVSAGRRHLYELKALLYGEDSVRENEKINHLDKSARLGFSEVLDTSLSFSDTVKGKSMIEALFSMTPYSKRTSKASAERLADTESLTITFEVNITVLRKDEKDTNK